MLFHVFGLPGEFEVRTFHLFGTTVINRFIRIDGFRISKSCLPDVAHVFEKTPLMYIVTVDFDFVRPEHIVVVVFRIRNVRQDFFFVAIGQRSWSCDTRLN